jgi:hypothetical protein
MGWKQTLILGGAALLLAACDRATAPIANVQEGSAATFARKGTDTTSTTSTTSTEGSGELLDPACRGSISINCGLIDLSCPFLD